MSNALTLRQFVVQFADVLAPYAQLEAFETAILDVWGAIAERQRVPVLYDVAVLPSVWAQTFDDWTRARKVSR